MSQIIRSKPQDRPLERFSDPSGGRELYKCEVDFLDGESVVFPSEKYAATKVPESSEELSSVLSEGQKTVLKDSKTQTLELAWRQHSRSLSKGSQGAEQTAYGDCG